MSSLAISSLFHLEGKVVLLTGGSRGLGKMMAHGLVLAGAKVYIVARSAAVCDATADELNALVPGKCISIPADLQKLEEIERVVDTIASHESGLHVLINNHGIVGETPLEINDGGAFFSEILEVNLHSVFSLTTKCLPLLRAGAKAGGVVDGRAYNDPARIINIGSLETEGTVFMNDFAYAASKAGVTLMSNTLAGQLGEVGITSNTIIPGPFATDMMVPFIPTLGPKILAKVPAGRFGKAEDIVGTCIFLASPASAYISGAKILLDGGAMSHVYITD